MPRSTPKELQQFNQPIVKFQGIQFILVDMAMAIEASRKLVYKSAAEAV